MKNKIIKVVLSCALILAVGLFFINKHTTTDNSDDFDKTNSQNYSRVDVEPTAKPIIEMNEENESSQMRTEEFMVEVVEIIEEEPTEEVVEVVPEEDFIVEVEEPTSEPTVTPVVEEEPTTEEPAPTATPTPNVTVKTEAEKQAELQTEALKRLEALGYTGTPTVHGDGLAGTSGNGTHYGDAQ